MRRVTLLAVLAVAGCGGNSVDRAAVAPKAERICDDAAVPAIPAPLNGSLAAIRVEDGTFERADVERA